MILIPLYAIFCVFLHVLWGFISPSLISGFNGLKSDLKAMWNNKAVSLVSKLTLFFTLN